MVQDQRVMDKYLKLLSTYAEDMGLEFNALKSVSLSIRGGTRDRDYHFVLNGEDIPTIFEKPHHLFLGMTIPSSGRNTWTTTLGLWARWKNVSKTSRWHLSATTSN